MNRQQELTNLLRDAANAYYNDVPVMDDREYDALFDELEALELASGTVLDGSPTANVGAEVTDTLAKVRHETPMLSLAKTKDHDALVDWLGGNVGCLSWKLDGATVVVTYEHGKLVQAVTRGNGHVGEDVTAQAKLFRFMPQTIKPQGRLVVRGEAIITYSEFNRINDTLPEAARYKNPRNLASGTMRSLDLDVLRERTVEFRPFELVSADGIDLTNSFRERLDLLAWWGFKPVDSYVVNAGSVTDVVDELEKWVGDNDFPTDGLVLQLDDVEYGRSLGVTGHHPRSGIAFKWADDTHETKLLDIEWMASRTGRLNPVAVFDAVEIDGTTVTRASLHNVTRIRELELGYGDTIEVYKANMVIPAVADNKTRSLGVVTDVLPDRCPVCGGPVSIRNDNGSEFLFCDNPDCMAKGVKRFVHFTGRDAMNIVGLSDERIQSLVDAGIVTTFADILDLPAKRAEIVGHVDGWGDGTFDNVAEAVEKAKDSEAARILYAMGIREVGRTVSKAICAQFGNDLDEIIKEATNGNADAFTRVSGVGPATANELIGWIQANEDTLNDVMARVTVTDKGKVEEAQDNDFVAGKTFVITGAVHTFANRAKFKAYVESMGGKVSGSVSRRTAYLVTNTPESGTGKNKKARELGVPVITEDEFCAQAGYVA